MTRCDLPSHVYLISLICVKLLMEKARSTYSTLQGAVPCSSNPSVSPTHRSLTWLTGTMRALSTTSMVVLSRSRSCTIHSQPVLSLILVIVISCRPISLRICCGISSVHSDLPTLISYVSTRRLAGRRTESCTSNGALPSKYILASLDKPESRQSLRVFWRPKDTLGRELISCDTAMGVCRVCEP